MKNYFSVLPALFAAMFVGGCSSDEPAGGASRGIMLSSEDVAVCESLEPLNLKLFSAACAVTEPSENVLFSPLSVTMLLSMRANYSEPEAKENILEVLGYGNLDDINSLNAKLLNQLDGLDKKTTLNLANSVWYDEGYTLVDDAKKNLADYYDAEFFACNPKLESTKRRITDWVSGKTNKNLQSFAPMNFAYLVMNVMYFNSTWTDKFDVKKTRLEHFYGRDGGSTVSMMYCPDGSGYYAQGEGFTACRKMFGNGAYSCTFMLPSKSSNIDEFIDNLSAEALSGLEYVKRIVNLEIPRFELGQQYEDLYDFFEELGLVDFSGSILKEYEGVPLFEHQTYIKFNEDGAEVAAVTTETDLLAPGTSTPSMRLDRPFVFFINEQSTGACILAGKIANL